MKKEIKVVNIVASSSLEHDIPLIKLAEALPNTEYNPEQFPGLVMRIKNPKTSALIFSSGKIVCTGVKDEETVKLVFDKLYRVVREYEVNMDPSKFGEFDDLEDDEEEMSFF